MALEHAAGHASVWRDEERADAHHRLAGITLNSPEPPMRSWGAAALHARRMAQPRSRNTREEANSVKKWSQRTGTG